MTSATRVYRMLQRALRAAGPLASGGTSKVARGVRGRRDAARTLTAWGRDARDFARPGVWFHAPSVGEGLQARAVLEAFRVRRPDLQAAYTHFSPSAETLASTMPADVATYLPWDLPDEMTPVLHALQPDAVVFTKTEVWPTLAELAEGRGIPLALVGGAVPPGARRARWPARALLRPMWARLSLGCAQTPEDAAGLVTLGVHPDRVVVTGDPGIDSAAQRARGADPGAPWLAPFHADPRPTVVAGSTWPADDARLLPALGRVRSAVPDVRAVLAPHEPGAEHVRALLARMEADGWTARTLAAVEEAGTAEGVDVVVVDRVGVLAHLYTVGWVAYVGGGFHDAGLHSVLEPAAARLPVVFGPRHANARAAGDLLRCGGAREAADAEGLGRVLTEWLTVEDARDYAAQQACGYIDGHMGAAERTAVLLDDLMT
ncbi:MAG TPA: glycosyltransferase N-terminal domain-containing protein [Longimicrobiales bacterium]|nr:glycosyltransferase N-terminal domain-containing protein [Longimicrobiales bacterium]